MRGLTLASNEHLQRLGYSKEVIKQLLLVQSESYTGAVTEIKQYAEGDSGLYVPRAFMEGIFYDPSSGDQGRSLHKSAVEMTLRPYQVEAVRQVKQDVLEKGGAILVGGCGTGKTVMGSFLIKELGRRALVLVHKEFLMRQFADTLRLAFPDWKIGFWARDEVPDGSEDVVIAMVQSLSLREYDQELYDGFGTVVTDEVHRFSAPQWSRAIAMFSAAYRIGLTATPDRKDGLQSIFLNSIGPISHRVEGNLLKPTIYVRQTHSQYDYSRYRQYDGSPSMAKLINLIAADSERSKRIAATVARAVSAGRMCLVLTDRREHATFLQHEIKLLCPDKKISLYLGGMKASERVAAESSDVLIGTYSMAQEGLDIPRLDTLFFATPKTNVTQAVGRILRPHPDKKKPFVVDFTDNNNITKAYYKKRQRYYESEGYEVFNKA